MDDLKRRLQITDNSLQTQVIQKLFQDVKGRTSHGVDWSNPTGELRCLWENCCEADLVVVSTSCDIFLHLVTLGKVHHSDILNGFLDRVPSAQNLCGLIDAISRLLHLQILQPPVTSDYTCPYSVCSPMHPYITIMVNRPKDSWPHLEHQISWLVNHQNLLLRRRALAFLDPFVKFILLNPDPTMQLEIGRLRTLNNLLNVAHSTGNEYRWDTVSYLVRLIPALQDTTSCNRLEVSNFLSDVATLFLSLPATAPSAVLNTFIRHYVSYVTLFLRDPGINVDRSLSQIEAVVTRQPLECSSESAIVALTFAIPYLPLRFLSPLLTSVHAMLKNVSSLTPLVAGVLIPPLLHIATMASPDRKRLKVIQKQTAAMLHIVEGIINTEEIMIEDSLVAPSHIQHCTRESHQLHNQIHLLKYLNQSPQSCYIWLEHFSQDTEPARDGVLHVVMAILLRADSNAAIKALNIICRLVEKNEDWAVRTFAVFQYFLARCRVCEVRLHVLHCIADLAVHKVCVQPVLRLIHNISKCQELFALSIHLLISVWKKQKRIYPELYRYLCRNVEKLPGTIDEVTVSKAFAVYEIVQDISSATQHGPELLSIISDILNASTRPRHAPATVFSLKALYILCQEEIIDLQSTWREIRGNFVSETRPLVVSQVCRLLSLSPQMYPPSHKYDEFVSESTSILWKYTTRDDDTIKGAAFTALSAFNINTFTIDYLPPQFQERVLVLSGKELDAVGDTVPVPCSFYIDILIDNAISGCLSDYETFLSAAVHRELTAMPRGMYHQSRHGNRSVADTSKLASSISSVLVLNNERNRDPDLKPPLAFSQLLCFDPRLEVPSDGVPRRNLTMTHATNYQQKFKHLLKEVRPDYGSWRDLLLLQRAWAQFICRLLPAMIQGRLAATDVLSKKHQMSPDEFMLEETAARLWVKDNITNFLVDISGNDDPCDGNKVLALCCLVSYMHENVTRAQADLSGWMSEILDGVLTQLNGQTRPGIHYECCALLGLPQLTTAILSHLPERMYDITSTYLTAHHRTICPMRVTLSSRLGIGLLLSKLSTNDFTRDIGSKSMIEFWRVLQCVEDAAFREDMTHRGGLYVCVGLAMSGLCWDGRADAKHHVTMVNDKLTGVLQNASEEIYEEVYTSIAMVTAYLLLANISSLTNSSRKLDELHSIYKETTVNVAVPLAGLCHVMADVGVQRAAAIRDELTRQSSFQLCNPNMPDSLRCEAVDTLAGLAGADKVLFPAFFQCTNYGAQTWPGVSESIKQITSLVSSKQAKLTVRSRAIMSLGSIYSALSRSTTTTTQQVSATFKYLGDSSLIRALVDFLLEAPHSEAVNPKHVAVVLTALDVAPTAQPYPPVNWSAILSPLLHSQYGTLVEIAVLSLAINQAKTSISAAVLLSHWMTRPLYTTLQMDSKKLLYSSLPSLVPHVPIQSLSQLILATCRQRFTAPSQDAEVCGCLLAGLGSALGVPDIPHDVTVLLHETIASLYADISDNTLPSIVTAMAACLDKLPNKVMDDVMSGDFMTHNVMSLVTLRCELVALGNQPVALLNPCIDNFITQPDMFVKSSLGAVLYALAQSLRKYSLIKEDGRADTLKWFVECLGHTKNIVASVSTSSSEITEKTRTTHLAASIVAMAICFLCNPSSPHPRISVTDGRVHLHPEESLSLLPSYIHCLLSDPWASLLPKVLDWMTFLCNQGDDLVPPRTRDYLLAAILSLRHCTDFRKMSVWSRIYARL